MAPHRSFRDTGQQKEKINYNEVPRLSWLIEVRPFLQPTPLGSFLSHLLIACHFNKSAVRERANILLALALEYLIMISYNKH